MARSRRHGALIGVFMLAAAALTACAPTPKALHKVTVAVGSQVLNSSYTYLVMPAALGYWRQEGLDVDLVPVGGSQQAIQQLVGGSADFVEVNASSLIQSVATTGLPLRALMVNTTAADWALVSLAGGPVKSVRDFKGRTIGIATLGSGGAPLVRAYLRANGLDPDKDVTLLPTGSAGMALQALQSGRVDGLMYWGSALLTFEMAGAKLNYFRAPEWATYADFSLATTDGVLAKNGAVAEALARGMAKASVFFAANPDCARKVLWKQTPQYKASAGDDAAKINFDDKMIALGAGQVTSARALGDGKAWATAPQAAYENMQRFMIDNKVIAKGAPGAALAPSSDPGFFQRANQFDAEQIRQQALRCDGV
jgi:NitT/TauT family transport system substrate-binding protein